MNNKLNRLTYILRKSIVILSHIKLILGYKAMGMMNTKFLTSETQVNFSDRQISIKTESSQGRIISSTYRILKHIYRIARNF